jgi:probable HAF family extracellular repeat protein
MTGLLQGHPQGQGSYATAINDLGDAVGFFGSGACFSGPAAWVFSGGLLTELTLADNGALPCTMGVSNDINNSGDIVGRMLFEGQDWRAFLYRGGVISNLGTLGGDFSDAKAINSHGQVVGASSTRRFDSAFLYQDDLLYDLNNMLLDNQLGWQLIDAQDINDNGQIAGEACYAAPVRHCFAVRLDPTDVPYDGPNGGVVPTPTTVSLVIFALAALGLQKRRSDFS